MSIRSLLQLILFLLIVLIIGGTYFFYFYKTPIINKENSNIIFDNGQENTVENLSNDREILQDLNKNNLNKKSEKIYETKEKKIEQKIKNDASPNEIKNLTKEIEYVTNNNNGDTFKILAKYGKTNIENTNILDLEIVNGTIISSERSDIYISSDYAKYNYSNQNSNFYSNVKINYDNKEITCDNLDLKISNNVAIAYNNVLIKDDKSIMKAQVVTMDIITKDININSKETIKIFTQ